MMFEEISSVVYTQSFATRKTFSDTSLTVGIPCIFQTILFLEQLLDFADTAGAMLLTQGIVNFHSPVRLLGWYGLTVP